MRLYLMIIILVESIICCFLFTIFTMAQMKNPIDSIHNYPPAIIARIKELGLITEDQEPKSKKGLSRSL